MGIDTEDFGFVLCDIDTCFCNVEMQVEFELCHQLCGGSIFAVAGSPSEVPILVQPHHLCRQHHPFDLVTSRLTLPTSSNLSYIYY